MPACLHCGKKIDADFLLWKGGESLCLCLDCHNQEKDGNETKVKEENKGNRGEPRS